jgi:hypothetical protein
MDVILDEEGVELPDIDAAKVEAVRSSGEMIKEISVPGGFWSGDVWKLWVTGTPDGTGTVYIKLEFSGFAIHG